MNKLQKILTEKRPLLALILIFLFAIFVFQIIGKPTKHSEIRVEPVVSVASTESPVSYETQVKPVLERRCIVCHACYDAPCQMKLSSIEGIKRGASEENIYNQRRLQPMQPTRLFIDAKTTGEWRERGFYPVLNEGKQTHEDNLKNSVLYHLLYLKRQNPQPTTEKLPEEVTVNLNREQSCPTLDTVDDFAKEHPLWGMPYAMPNLSTQEYDNLVNWIAQGSSAPTAPGPSIEIQKQITQWETFLNQSSNKEKLVARYLYEHLFHAHIHFADSPEREFYRLVRSSTPPGETINEIATLRPYDDPGDAPFYYRLLKFTPSIVAKNHIVYELSAKRMLRYRSLFLEPEYAVKRLPSYVPEIASNPFKVFEAIPAESRYRFLLDEAYFFIEGFIKGPVCRGQIALNVIEDQFWVMFFDPKQPIITNTPAFIEQMADLLQVPAVGDSNFELIRIWTDYWKGQRRYMEKKQAWFKTIGRHDLDHAMNFIWDGDGKNPNASMTIFRHFDSGSVAYGLVGDYPETAWVIDYPLLERIHYLLVAGFNVFGNIDHVMSTRIYMDFLRMEGEDNFLAFLPINKRKQIRDSWYVGQRSTIEKIFNAPQEWLTTDSIKGYQTDDPQPELYQHIKERLAPIKKTTDAMNLCGKPDCSQSQSDVAPPAVDQAMAEIAKLQGKSLHAFPDVAFVRVIGDNENNGFAYTLIRNKAYKNVTSFLADELERDRADIEKDSMTVVNWLEGTYPNFFFSVKESDIDEFVKQCVNIRAEKDYEDIVNQYGVRRTNPVYWSMADWFQEEFRRNKKITAGLFDLNRYQN